MNLNSFPDEVILRIYQHLVPTIAQIYGGTGNSFTNLQNMGRIHSQILTLKQLNKKFKKVADILLLNSRELYQLMFLCGTGFKFLYIPSQSKIMSIECYQDVPRFANDIIQLLTLPKNSCFDTIQICCKSSQNWLPFLNHFLRESWKFFKPTIHTKVVLIDQCSDHHSWAIYNRWESCQEAIVELDYLLRFMSMGVTRIGNSLLCSSCNQTDFNGPIFDDLVYCDECGDSIPVDNLCFECIHFCSCMELVYDYKETEFKNGCSRVICEKRFGKVPHGKKWISKNCSWVVQCRQIDDFEQLESVVP